MPEEERQALREQVGKQQEETRKAKVLKEQASNENQKQKTELGGRYVWYDRQKEKTTAIKNREIKMIRGIKEGNKMVRVEIMKAMNRLIAIGRAIIEISIEEGNQTVEM